MWANCLASCFDCVVLLAVCHALAVVPCMSTLSWHSNFQRLKSYRESERPAIDLHISDLSTLNSAPQYSLRPSSASSGEQFGHTAKEATVSKLSAGSARKACGSLQGSNRRNCLPPRLHGELTQPGRSLPPAPPPFPRPPTSSQTQKPGMVAGAHTLAKAPLCSSVRDRRAAQRDEVRGVVKERRASTSTACPPCRLPGKIPHTYSMHVCSSRLQTLVACKLSVQCASRPRA